MQRHEKRNTRNSVSVVKNVKTVNVILRFQKKTAEL